MPRFSGQAPATPDLAVAMAAGVSRAHDVGQRHKVEALLTIENWLTHDLHAAPVVECEGDE